MLIVDSQPKLTELHKLIAALDYPISIKRLVKVASQKNFHPEIIDFYKSFPDDQVLSRDDLEARTEQIEIMRTQSSPAEDTIHGAED